MTTTTLSTEVLQKFQELLTDLAGEADLVVEIVAAKKKQATLKFMVVGKNNVLLTSLPEIQLEVGSKVTLASLANFVKICIS